MLNAVEREDVQTAERLLWLRPSLVDIVDEVGASPLHLAVQRNDAAMVALLLRAGADPNRDSPTLERPLNLAAGVYNGLPLCRMLLDAGADVNGRSHGMCGGETTPLHKAAGGQLELARMLVERGADVNARDHYQGTPLHYAAVSQAEWRRRKMVIELLIEHHAEVNACDYWDKTPLAYLGDPRSAREEGDLADVLVKHGGIR
jgi:ankyrin repeat protein